METIWLQRPSSDIPWGFRLQGGREFDFPLSVHRVTPGSVAANGLNAGDVILKIGNVNATNLSHTEAQDVIRGASNILQFTIRKGAITSTPVSPTFSVPQYQGAGNQYGQEPDIPNYPDYRVGSGYSNYGNNVNQPDMYNNTVDQFNQSQPVSGYSTLPVRGSANKHSSESFRPVIPQQQQQQPQKTTSGIQLQLQPYGQNMPHEDPGQYSSAISYSQPMSPVQYPIDSLSDQQYQRQASVGSNRSEPNSNHPASYFKKPTPFSPTGLNQNGSATPPPRLTRQSSASSQSSVHEATVTPGFQPGSFLPRSADDAPPPPPPPANYTQPDMYRQQSYNQDNGASPYQRQSSQPYQRQTSQGRQPAPSGMYVDTTPSTGSQYQRQGSQPGYNDNRYPQSPASFQRQPSYGSQQQQQPVPPPPPPQQYSSPYTPAAPPQPYGRQSSRGQVPESPQYSAMSPPGSGPINSFEDILSPFENFQNSNYCDKLFARDSRDADSGIMSDSYHSQSMSDTPRSNQSSNFSGYSPPQSSYPGGPGMMGAPYGQNQNLLQPAPPAPPPPAITPPPPPPPPPPSNWTPSPRRAPQQQDRSEGDGSQMPDKVLTTMMKNKGTQKPFSYIPTGLDIQKFKDKARQRAQPRSVMPRGYAGPDLDADDSPAEFQQPQTSRAKPAPGAPPKPDSGVYKHAQYNSPLRMYSSDNARDALNVQSGGDVDVSGVNNNHYYCPPRDPQQFVTPSRSPQQFISVPQKTVRTPERSSDIKESEVYKMIKEADAKGKNIEMPPVETETGSDVPRDSQERILSPPPIGTRGQGLSFRVLQWLTDTAEDNDKEGENVESYKPKKPRNPLLRHNSEDDEMRFSGLHTKADIPSKIFQRLNQMTVADDAGVEPVCNEPENQDEPEPRIGNYDEASIRYRGKYIPSPSFRLLQTLANEDNQNTYSPGRTDDEDDGLPDQLTEEDMVDRRYKGAYIPSKAFKTLQMCVGDDGSAPTAVAPPAPAVAKSNPRIKVISQGGPCSPQVVNRTESPKPAENPSTDF